jgi:hypothetical protein
MLVWLGALYVLDPRLPKLPPRRASAGVATMLATATAAAMTGKNLDRVLVMTVFRSASTTGRIWGELRKLRDPGECKAVRRRRAALLRLPFTDAP